MYSVAAFLVLVGEVTTAQVLNGHPWLGVVSKG